MDSHDSFDDSEDEISTVNSKGFTTPLLNAKGNQETKMLGQKFAIPPFHSTQSSNRDDAKGIDNDDNKGKRFLIPLLHTKPSTASETQLLSTSTGHKFIIPTLNHSDSAIPNILAGQIANMLKAKEMKRQEENEKQKLAEKLGDMKLQEEIFEIDLTQSIQKPGLHNVKKPSSPSVTSNSSIEDVFEQPFFDNDIEGEKLSTPEPSLPCLTDMSYILLEKIKKGKCSPFGKVVTARLKPVAAPYLKERIESKIVRFKFETKSPCDLIKDKLRRPTTHCNNMNSS